MTGWENVAFIHLCITQYISPPELVCLILTSRDLCETYGNPETYRAVAKSFFGPAINGPRGHVSRRHRQNKGVWRAGDGAKARLSLLWRERTRTSVLQLQNDHLVQQREHERRWVLQQAAAVMRTCPYASRHNGSCCSHAKLRLWTSANIVAAKQSSRSQERPPSHHGVRCSRCGTGPVVGSAYRCAAGCFCASSNTKATPSGAAGVSATGPQQRVSSWPALRSSRGLAGRDVRERSGGGNGGSDNGRGGKPGGHSAESGGGGGRGGGAGEGCYTLCEGCFSERRKFHPPHPFARLRAGFAESRLSGPVLYEAVCGDCSFGSLVLVRPLKAREALGDHPSGSGDLWAVPVRVEAAGPLPLSQVKSRIAAGDRDDNRGLAFASDTWLLRQQQEVEEEKLEGGAPGDPLF
eukprot:g6157.t1